MSFNIFLERIMIILQNITYIHPNKELLFDDISLTVKKYEKIALIGNNGSGKSTLLKIIAGELHPHFGTIKTDVIPYYIPQNFGQHNDLTISQALKVDRKLDALTAILSGDVSVENYTTLDDDWTIEERCKEAFQYWELTNLELSQKMGSLSGGQKTKVFLSGIQIHQPELLLLDEPSNHLDLNGRQLLYDFVQSTKITMLVISHDRKLLNILDSTREISKHGIKIYGGNYAFYQDQKQIENNAISQNILDREKALRQAKEKERETIERQQKLESRGKSKQTKSGVARIMMNTLRNNAENTSSKLKNVHAEKLNSISTDLNELRSAVTDISKMKFGFDASTLHKGKVLFSLEEVNVSIQNQPLWKQNLNLKILSGERIALKGSNGSGKTTLIQLILDQIECEIGQIQRSDLNSLYIDQDYSQLDNQFSVFEQAQFYNVFGLQEHEVKTRLNRFLFSKENWDKPCSSLSGGERMRLLLCCLTVQNQSVNCIVLDEPTNNLDIQNIEILVAAIKEYRGTLIVVSHDESFLEQMDIERIIELDN